MDLRVMLTPVRVGGFVIADHEVVGENDRLRVTELQVLPSSFTKRGAVGRQYLPSFL